MFRIDTPNKAVDLFGAGKHGFRDGDKVNGINATELSAAQQNALQEELAAIIEASGGTLNKANNAQVLEAIKRLIDAQSGNYALDTGVANAYVVALDPAITAYADGMTVRVKVVNANTGAATLNAGAGAVPLVNDVGGALAYGDVPAGGIFTAIYIASAGKFYINSIVQSQSDARLHGRNLMVNGSCMVDQLSVGALITPATSSYPIDNALYTCSVASKLQSQQVTNKLNSLGVTHAHQLSVLASYTPAASDSFIIYRPIEGVDFAKLRWGTADAQPVSLQIKLNAAIAGTYSGALRNPAGTRAYPFTATLAANTDTLVKIENIPGETSGVWPAGEGVVGAYVTLDLGSVAAFRTTAGAWATGNYVGATGAADFVSQANGSLFTYSEIQFEAGRVCTQFEKKSYKDELAACQRYFPVFNAIPSGARLSTGFAKSTTQAEFTFSLPTTTCKPVTAMTITNASGFSALIGTSSTVTTANALTSSSRNSASITTDVTGLTANQATVLIANNASCGIYFEGARI